MRCLASFVNAADRALARLPRCGRRSSTTAPRRERERGCRNALGDDRMVLCKETQLCQQCKPSATLQRRRSSSTPRTSAMLIAVSEKPSGHPLLLLQHFTGTLDNWDPAVTDQLSIERELILFDNAGIGRSTGTVPKTIDGMAQHARAFLEALELETCDVLGYSLGGMVAQQMIQDNSSIFRRMILVGTAPRGGEDIMHLEKPNLAKYSQRSNHCMAMPCCRRYFSRQRHRAKPPERHSSTGSRSVRMIVIRLPVRPSRRPRSQRFVNGSNLRASASPI